MFSRAERRHHIERLKETRKHYWSHRTPLTPKQLGKVVQYPQMCSCPSCGNSRRHPWFKGERLTVQERSHNEALKTFGTEE